MKSNKILLFLFAAILFTGIFPYTIYIVQSEDNEIYDKMIYSFKERAEFDFVQFNLKGDDKQAAEIAAKAKIEKPDAILLIGFMAVKEISAKIDNIPLIMSMSSSIPQNIKDKSNTCGVVFDLEDATTIEYLKTAVPNMKNLGIIFSVENSIDYAKSFKSKCEELGLSMELGNIASLEELPLTCKMLKASGVKGIWLGRDKLVVSKAGFETLLKITKDENLPIIAPYATFTQKGAAFSISPDISNHGYMAGNIAIRLKNGERPSEIGFFKTEKVAFSYNKNMLKLFNISVISSILDKAKEY
ncbi:MAG: ABC transporter substrate binding protein [bacterium]|nr:ABC transporter substrate binding protein [bacterium]